MKGNFIFCKKHIFMIVLKLGFRKRCVTVFICDNYTKT